jgi:hypothetical protein
LLFRLKILVVNGPPELVPDLVLAGAAGLGDVQPVLEIPPFQIPQGRRMEEGVAAF